MKIEPFLIASTANIAIGQRLVRKLCQNCRFKKTLSELEFENLKEAVRPEILKKHREFYAGKGCSICEDGYEGRIGIYEVLEVTEPIRELIMKRADSSVLKEEAIKEGMTTMFEDGFKKALAGITTIEEILRIIHE